MKRKLKRKLFPIACFFCCLMLAGCWNRRELNELGIVLAIGIDKDRRTGEVILTSQVVRPGALKQESAAEKSPVEITMTRGKTVFEAMRNITKQFDRKAYFSHDKVIVIDERLAREGILKVIDVFVRSQEIRRQVWFMVAKDTTAGEILGVEHGIETVQATYLESMIKSKSRNSEVSAPSLLEIVKAVSGGGTNPVAGVMEMIEQPNLPAEKEKEPSSQGVKLSGTAVFKKDKLVGYLNDRETRGLHWVTGKVQSGVIQVPAPGEPGRLITVEIKKASSRIKPEIKNGRISFHIAVKEEGNIVEQQSIIDSSKLKTFEKIAAAQKKVIADEIGAAVAKVQKQLGSDIFGFGSLLNQKYPQEWEKIKKNWDALFPEVQWTVTIDAELRRSGLLLKPVKRGE
ncbi:spore germination protein KC [Hydrogenispora ethanolica]|uniref:Spore germination protein KC n=1 Tax=Hydrogenispora ethanolica TaxID=1082276 RepID=A0A4R1SBG5_HYDET|nr:Ger(x)C family spore germination protein [Hydrogenispora ethanolica]TCL76841.1 spore germination protein KC [Hydrogenispora ethanolica]